MRNPRNGRIKENTMSEALASSQWLKDEINYQSLLRNTIALRRMEGFHSEFLLNIQIIG